MKRTGALILSLCIMLIMLPNANADGNKIILSQIAKNELYCMLSPFGNGVGESMSFDENTDVERILYEYVLEQQGCLYLLFDYEVIEENRYQETDPLNVLVDDCGYPFYAKIDADIVENVFYKYFNVEKEDIASLHDGNIYYSYDYDIPKGYYYNGSYYFRLWDGLGGGPISFTNHEVIKSYGNDIYKIKVIQEEFDYIDYSVYCIVQSLDNGNSFKMYGLSENEDLDYISYVQVTLDNNKISFDQPPVSENGRVLLPMRKIAETLGAEVEWNGATQTITAVKGDIMVYLTLNDKTAYKNGQAIILDVPAKVINERTLVPVRFLADCFGVGVDWVQETQTVVLTTQ